MLSQVPWSITFIKVDDVARAKKHKVYVKKAYYAYTRQNMSHRL